MEEMVCSRCGGALDDDLKCPYCGVKYKRNDPTTQIGANIENINVTVNIQGPSQQAEVQPIQEPSEPEPQLTPVSPSITDDEAEDEDEVNEDTPKEKWAGLSSFVSKFWVIIIILVGGGAIVMVYGRRIENDLYMAGGIIAFITGLIFATYYNGGKKK